jgi:hypothetical protein
VILFATSGSAALMQRNTNRNRWSLSGRRLIGAGELRGLFDLDRHRAIGTQRRPFANTFLSRQRTRWSCDRTFRRRHDSNVAPLPSEGASKSDISVIAISETRRQKSSLQPRVGLETAMENVESTVRPPTNRQRTTPGSGVRVLPPLRHPTIFYANPGVCTTFCAQW